MSDNTVALIQRILDIAWLRSYDTGDVPRPPDLALHIAQVIAAGGYTITRSDSAGTVSVEGREAAEQYGLALRRHDIDAALHWAGQMRAALQASAPDPEERP